MLILLVCSNLALKACDTAGAAGKLAIELSVTADIDKRYSDEPFAIDFTAAWLKAIVLLRFAVKSDAEMPTITYSYYLYLHQ